MTEIYVITFGTLIDKNLNTQIINKHKFPDILKLADETRVFDEEDSNLDKNYRSVSILPIVSKIFEKQLQKQTVSHINQFLNS